MTRLETRLTRRTLLKLGAISAVATALPACSDSTTAEMMTGPEMDEAVRQISAWETKGVLTSDEPGQWAEKIVGHFPIAYRKPGGVQVIVAHPMDAEHYIEGIYLKNGSGDILGFKTLAPGDTPDVFFELSSVPDDLKVYAPCNLHQVWVAPMVRTGEEPGPWADKIGGHTPRLTVADGEVSVDVLHPMTPDHAILGIYLTDQNNNVFSKVQLARTDEPKWTVPIPPGVTEVRAWALCDDHDLWVNEPIDVATAALIPGWEAQGVLTSNEPGEWAGKIVGHYPIGSIDGHRVVVHTPHEMTDEHYIEAIYIKDSDGFLVGCKKLSPGDWPAASFNVFDPSMEYTVYSVCNLHQVWAAPLVRSGERPGPWTDKVASHTPQATFDPSTGSVTVTVSHPMTEEHRIVGVYISDQNGSFIGKKQLSLEETDVASYTFTLPRSTTRVTPWALCDDHDLWYGPSISV